VGVVHEMKYLRLIFRTETKNLKQS